jgi:hypothetical protein
MTIDKLFKNQQKKNIKIFKKVLDRLSKTSDIIQS